MNSLSMLHSQQSSVAVQVQIGCVLLFGTAIEIPSSPKQFVRIHNQQLAVHNGPLRVSFGFGPGEQTGFEGGGHEHTSIEIEMIA